MSRKVLISTLLGGALAVAAVVGLVAYRSANAAASIVAAPANYGFGQGSFERGPGGPGRPEPQSNEDLAEALGISVDDLNAAYTAANAAALEQAVKDGLITQAQADELKANKEAFPFGGRWGGWLSQKGIDYDALLADALGITTEKLQAARDQVRDANIDQAVTDGKLTQEQADLMKGRNALFADQGFRSAMQSAFEAAVKQAVSDGVITQAQADLILKEQDGAGFPGMRGFDGPPGGPGFDGPHGHGRRGGQMPGNPPDTTTTTP
jgi:hypothetical protein